VATAPGASPVGDQFQPMAVRVYVSCVVFRSLEFWPPVGIHRPGAGSRPG
jgi:hypothetical protein